MRNAQKGLRLKDYFVISRSYVIPWKGGSDIKMNISYKYIKNYPKIKVNRI